MRPILRVASLAVAAGLMAASPAAGQQDVAAVGDDGCLIACALTASACHAAVNTVGASPDFCLGWLAGCIIGCSL